MDWGRREAEMSEKGRVMQLRLLWEASHHPALLENLILMDKIGNACDRPFGTLCDEA